MKTYCVKCRKKTKNLNSKILETKYYAIKMCLLWIKKSRFVKEQEAKGLLSSLGLQT